MTSLRWNSLVDKRERDTELKIHFIIQNNETYGECQRNKLKQGLTKIYRL